MNTDDLTIKQARELVAMLSPCVTKQVSQEPGVEPEIGSFVIVRSRDAGVIFGKYQGREGCNINLTEARQLWSWFAAKGITLIDAATFGVTKGKCRFSTAQASVTIFNACALIEVTDIAASSIQEV